MLIQHVPLLCTKRIVLASASPRRSELLRGLVRFVPTFDALKGRNRLAAFVALLLALGFDELVGIYAGPEG
jgi:hypothetical protein